MDIISFGNKSSTAVVFLHGWGGGLESFSGFAKVISDKTFSVVVEFNSLLNSGKVLTIDDFADELYNKLNELGITQAVLVGHSFGGRVIARFNRDHAEMVKKVVLVDSAGLIKRKSLVYRLKVMQFKICKKLANLKLISSEKLNKFGSADYKKLPDEQKQTFVNIVNTDLAEDFKKISVPTLIYWGEKDTETPLYMAKKLNKLIDGSGLVIIKNGGHFSYLDDQNKFILVLRSFIDA